MVLLLFNGINFYGFNEKYSDKDMCICEEIFYYRNLILDIVIWWIFNLWINLKIRYIWLNGYKWIVLI